MIKASKVVFISEELEEDFKSLKIDDPIKKGMTRAIVDLKENALIIRIMKRDLSIKPNKSLLKPDLQFV